MRSRVFLSVAAVVVFAAVLSLPVSGAMASGIRLGPRIDDGSAKSLNWAGYVLTGAAGKFTSVAGSWNQPSVACSGGASYAAFWAGIDGANSNTVEQAGTLAHCASGRAAYTAWYEFFPARSVTISSITVHPGDTMSVSVTYSGSGTSFAIALQDVSTGKRFSVTGSVSEASRSSAECITERPSIGGSITHLADFGHVGYGAGNTGVSGTCDADGQPFGSAATEIVMVSNSGRTTLAQPSGLASGNSFTVTWRASG